MITEVKTYNRIANIDRLRILSAFGIVWYHIKQGPEREIGHSGLAVFLMISCMLIAVKGHRDNRLFILKKAERLIVPWLFWCAVYFVFNISKALIQHVPVKSMFDYYMFLTGPAIHLWYLPYAFVAGIVVNWALKYTGQSAIKNFSTYILIAAGLLSLAFCSFLLSEYRINWPFEQWIFGLSACFLGWGMGFLALGPFARRLTMVIFTAASVCLVSVVLLVTRYDALVVPYSIAAGAFLIPFIRHGRMDKLTAFAAPLTLGIYLIHPIAAQLINYTWFRIDRDFWDICIVFLISLGISFILQQFSRRYIRRISLI